MVADALSRMEANFEENKPLSTVEKAQMCASYMANNIKDKSLEMPHPKDHDAMAQTFMSKNVDDEAFPLISPVLIAREQTKDEQLKNIKKSGKSK